MLVVILVLALGGFVVIKSYLCQINRTYDQDISEAISPKEAYFEVDETDENGDETIDPGSYTELDDKGDSNASDEIAFIAPDDVEWDFIERIEDDKLGCILPTPNAPGQRVFSRCAAPFFLEIRQYSCEKMSYSTQKFLAAGHIGSFQIHPNQHFVGWPGSTGGRKPPAI